MMNITPACSAITQTVLKAGYRYICRVCVMLHAGTIDNDVGNRMAQAAPPTAYTCVQGTLTASEKAKSKLPTVLHGACS